METAPKSGKIRYAELLTSPTLIVSLVLVIVYVIVGELSGNLADPLNPSSPERGLFLDVLVQCDNPTPIFPWTLITAIFLHANILHIASNILFLLLFGFVLQEQVSKSQWIATFFITGLAGSLGFVAYDVLGYLATGYPNPNSLPDCAVGASGAIYGIMGTAVGLRVVILLIFLLGLDVFAGGGGPAHLGGLVAGLILRSYWSLGSRGFRGI